MKVQLEIRLTSGEIKVVKGHLTASPHFSTDEVEQSLINLGASKRFLKTPAVKDADTLLEVAFGAFPSYFAALEFVREAFARLKLIVDETINAFELNKAVEAIRDAEAALITTCKARKQKIQVDPLVVMKAKESIGKARDILCKPEDELLTISFMCDNRLCDMA